MPTIDTLTPQSGAALADSDVFYVGIPGDADPDRQMTYTQLRAGLDDYFALLTGATFTGGIELPNDGALISGTSPRIRFEETDTTDENWWLVNDAGRLIAQLRNDAGSFVRQMFAVDPTSGPLASPGGGSIYPIVDFGGSAAEGYVRLYDGTQICWENYLTLSYVSSQECRVTWTFPAAFDSDAYALTATLRGVTSGTATSSIAANAAPSTDMIAHISQGYITSTSVALGAFRQNGKTSFNASDNMYARAIAVGRWY